MSGFSTQWIRAAIVITAVSILGIASGQTVTTSQPASRGAPTTGLPPATPLPAFDVQPFTESLSGAAVNWLPATPAGLPMQIVTPFYTPVQPVTPFYSPVQPVTPFVPGSHGDIVPPVYDAPPPRPSPYTRPSGEDLSPEGYSIALEINSGRQGVDAIIGLLDEASALRGDARHDKYKVAHVAMAYAFGIGQAEIDGSEVDIHGRPVTKGAWFGRVSVNDGAKVKLLMREDVDGVPMGLIWYNEGSVQFGGWVRIKADRVALPCADEFNHLG